MEVDAEALYRPFETLSSGERTKVMLAVLFLKEHSFLLIDEPTNHLDTEARRAVSRYLNRKKGFILVSHDRVFMAECIDHVLSLNKNTIEVVQGNFTSWWDNKQRRDEFEAMENEKLKKEIGRLKDCLLYTSWANWVETWEDLKTVYGLEHTDTDMSSAEEISLFESEKKKATKDIGDVGQAFGPIAEEKGVTLKYKTS